MKRLALIVIVLLSPASVSAIPVILDVPAYSWYHGCGPTAAASVLGYWDLNGYGGLFDASDSDVFITSNVASHIWNDTPAYDSIADFFHTDSEGWSYLSYSDDAFEGYAAHRGYEFDSGYWSFFSIDWEWLTAELTYGPVMALISTNADTTTDHFVPIVGYDDRGADGLWYGCYTTWSESESVYWQPWRPMSYDYGWGVGYLTWLMPVSSPGPTNPVPEPATMVLLTLGLAVLFIVKHSADKFSIRAPSAHGLP